MSLDKSKKNISVAGLSADDIKQCKIFFKTFDRDGNGSVDLWELRLALQAMGMNPSDAEVRDIMSKYDQSQTGKLEFPDFLHALQMQRKNESKEENKRDLFAAFCAMGGEADGTGSINAEQLRKVIKEDFGLSIKIDELIDDLDANNDGFVSFEEFKTLLG